MSPNTDYGVAIEIEVPIKFQKRVVSYIGGIAYSWPNSGTLRAVYVDGEEVCDPDLYGADCELDLELARAVWKTARACSLSLQDKFDELAVSGARQMVNG